MAKRADDQASGGRGESANGLSSPVEALLLAALERGGDTLETGRYLVTYKETAADAGMQAFRARGMRVADARDFEAQAATLERTGDADALVFPEIGVAVVGGAVAQERGLTLTAEIASDSAIASIDPEYFVFSQDVLDEALRQRTGSAFGEYRPPADAFAGAGRGGAMAGEPVSGADYLRGFARAAEIIANDLRALPIRERDEEMEAAVLGATWGLQACRVPQSMRSGIGIKVAVLDTGMDMGHPDFAGRLIVSGTFVGQPVQDLHSHGTHCIGTACGPLAPPGATPRYGIAHRSTIFAGKVLTNSGSGTQAAVLAGMNWAIANRCPVISMSLGSQSPVHPAYTAAGQAALNVGCLIIAAAGNAASNTGSPANSPTIMSVASVDPNLAPSSFSNFGKVEIAGPGGNVYSSVPRPTRYGTKSGTSMATPHVAGCAALLAEMSPSLRGMVLWNRLRAMARPLPFPATRVGAGLVQAP
jgi:subtilisin family serine protease